MPTMNECQHNAELCLKLASETKEFYAKIALFELAKEFRARSNTRNPPAWPIRIMSGAIEVLSVTTGTSKEVSYGH